MRAGERPPRLPLWAAVVLSVASALVLVLAYPSPNVWILAFPGVAGMLVALRGRGFWGGVLVGFAGGFAYYVGLISWITLFLGPAPLFALGGLESIYVALGGGLIAVADRAVPAVWAGRWGRIGLTPLVVAACWTAREAICNTFPYGGFAWARVALSQSTGPFAPLVAWTGLSGLSFLLVWLVAFAVAVAAEPAHLAHGLPVVPRIAGRAGPVLGGSRADRIAVVSARALAVLVAIAALLAVPPIRPQETGVIRVAGIQADTRSGYFRPPAYVGALLDANLRRTLAVIPERPDLVVWPEGASDISPLASTSAANDWDAITRATGAPLLAGVITDRGGEEFNSSLLWEPSAGPTAIYDKVHPVPFAEYVPDRAFWTPFAPSLLKLIGRDFAIGTRSSVLKIGAVRVGVDICFDIADDGLILGSVADGAQVLVAQTNNADFGRTAETQQQLAIARMRAIETGRSVVSVGTVSSTGVIGPDGRTLAEIPSFRAGTLVADVPLARGTTPAVAFGVPLGIALAVFGAGAPLIASALARRPRALRRRR